MLGYSFSLGQFRPSIAAGPAFHFRSNERSYGKVLYLPGYGNISVNFDNFTMNIQYGVCAQVGTAYLLTKNVNTFLNARYERGGRFLGYPDDKTFTTDLSFQMGLNFRIIGAVKNK